MESYLFEGPMFVVIKTFWFRGGVILWVSGLRDYNARQFTTLFNVHENVNLWVRVTYKIHECQSPMNNNDSTVMVFLKLSFFI